MIRLPSPSSIRPEGRAMLGTAIRRYGRVIYVVNTHVAPSGPNRTAQLPRSAAISTRSPAAGR